MSSGGYENKDILSIRMEADTLRSSNLQRITQQRQYRGLPPTADGGGVKGAK